MLQTNPEIVNIFDLIHSSVKLLLKEKGIIEPTPIQKNVFKIIFEGHDAIAQSQTGSGKTLAFGLPCFQKLNQPSNANIRFLVLTPTRELAQQIADVFSHYFQPLGFKILAIMGGKSYKQQKQSLKRGIDVVVATPGRLNDLIEQKAIDISQIEILALDEMDEMLDFGFANDILKIKEAISQKPQILLFSATFAAKVNAIARKMVHKPKEINISPTEKNLGCIKHEFLEVKTGRHFDGLMALLLYHFPEQCIIFCKTRDETRSVFNALIERGFTAGLLNGEMTQGERLVTMDRFKRKTLKILVATDVAARGIDVTGLSHVINFSVPTNIEAYTHRTGRTGRAGADGKAWTVVSYMERREYQFLCSKLKISPTRLELPDPKTIFQQIVKNFIFNVNTDINIESGSLIPSQLEKNIENYIESLSQEEKQLALINLIRSGTVRHLGRNLNLDQISPAQKTEFDNSTSSFARSRHYSDRKVSSSGGGGSHNRRPFSTSRYKSRDSSFDMRNR